VKLFLWAIVFCVGQILFAEKYVIIVSAKTSNDQQWSHVVSTLKEKHSATVIHYEKSVKESLPALRKSFPRYACFVATPQETTKEFVKIVHTLTRRLDQDPYTDLFWGILSGFDASNALEIAKTTEPLIIRNSLACTEIALERCKQGKWFCELRKGHGVTKKTKGKAKPIRLPQDTTALFVKELNEGQTDLFVTSGHATQKDLQLGFRYKNGVLKCKDGSLFGADLSGKKHFVDSPNPKIFMPIGNCLIGHMNGPGSMAASFFKSAGIRQMMGYVEVTWYGYMGWGCLDYFLEQPGRYTFTESFFANHHALIHRLENCFPGSNQVNTKAGPPIISSLAQELGLGQRDVKGLLFDRDIVAFYGDPAWKAQMAEGPKNWRQTLVRKGNQFTFTITPLAGSKSYKPVNENGVQRGYRPFIEFFRNRISDVTILSGQKYKPEITDNFILVPNYLLEKSSEPVRIIFEANRIDSQ